MDVYRRTVLQARLWASSLNCVKDDCKMSLRLYHLQHPSLLRVDIIRSLCVSGRTGLNSCNKNRGVIKTVRIAGCQTQLPCHTHTHTCRERHPGHVCEASRGPICWRVGWHQGDDLLYMEPKSLSILRHIQAHAHTATPGIQACFCGYSFW